MKQVKFGQSTILPDKFSIRIKNFPGLTHTVKMNAHGDYEIKWSRGFFEAMMARGMDISGYSKRVVDDTHMKHWLRTGQFVIVEEAVNKVSTKHLPDEFWFCTSSGTDYKATKRDGFYQVTWTGEDEGTTYSLTMALGYVRDGIWKLCKASLTPEQQRAIKEFKEQLTQLDSSIRIAEQTIEHHNRMIGNYQERQEVLRKKIAEMEGL